MATNSPASCVLFVGQHLMLMTSAVFLIGQLKLVQAVTQCIRCDSMLDSSGQGTDCDQRLPTASYCSSHGPANVNYLCMLSREYDKDGNQTRVLRECTSTFRDQFSCITNSPEQVANKYPAKACYWTCPTDACNVAASRLVSEAPAAFLLGGLLIATAASTWVV